MQTVKDPGSMIYGDKLLFLGQGKKCDGEKRESGKFAITRPLR